MARVTDNLEQEIERAHLLFLRGELGDARKTLEDLNARCPGHADVERLLAEVVIKPPPTTPTRRDWTQAITKDLPRSVVGMVFGGLYFGGFGAFNLISAMQAGATRGFRSTATLLVPLGRRGLTFELPAWAASCFSVAIAAFGSLLLCAAWWRILRAMEAPA